MSGSAEIGSHRPSLELGGQPDKQDQWAAGLVGDCPSKKVAHVITEGHLDVHDLCCSLKPS